MCTFHTFRLALRCGHFDLNEKLNWDRLVERGPPGNAEFMLGPHYGEPICDCNYRQLMFFESNAWCKICLKNFRRGGQCVGIGDAGLNALRADVWRRQMLSNLHYQSRHFDKMAGTYQADQAPWQQRIYLHGRAKIVRMFRWTPEAGAQLKLYEADHEILKDFIGPTPLNQTMCLICHGNLRHQDGEEDCRGITHLVFLPCDHIFGRRCIERWLDERVCCPICRVIIPHSSVLHTLTFQVEELFDNPPLEPSWWRDTFAPTWRSTVHTFTHLGWPAEPFLSFCYRHTFWILNPNEWPVGLRIDLLYHLSQQLPLLLATYDVSLSTIMLCILATSLLVAIVQQSLPPASIERTATVNAFKKLRAASDAIARCLYSPQGIRCAGLVLHVLETCAWFSVIGLLVQLFRDDAFRTLVLLFYAVGLPLLLKYLDELAFYVRPSIRDQPLPVWVYLLISPLLLEAVYYVTYLWYILIAAAHLGWFLTTVLLWALVAFLKW